MSGRDIKSEHSAGTQQSRYAAKSVRSIAAYQRMATEADVIASEFDKKGVEAERQTHTPAGF